MCSWFFAFILYVPGVGPAPLFVNTTEYATEAEAVEAGAAELAKWGYIGYAMFGEDSGIAMDVAQDPTCAEKDGFI